MIESKRYQGEDAKDKASTVQNYEMAELLGSKTR